MLNEKEVQETIISLLENIYDPEIPVNIYALGLIYAIELTPVANGFDCMIKMTLTSPGCPVAENLTEQVYNISYMIDEIQEMKVNIVFEPQWDSQTMMSYEAKLELGLL